MNHSSLLAVFACALLPACSSGSLSSSSRPLEPTVSVEPARNADVDPALLRSIATEYASWHRVDEWSHWAPEMCRLRPSEARISASDDDATHGRKLYFLYAKDRAAYMTCAERAQPSGQVVVKESWTPVEVGADELAQERGRMAGASATAEHGGKHWKPGEKQGLFVMIKLGPDAVGSDAGWVFATTSADGNVVHASGRIESCMGCHDEGTHDRLFGLKD